MIIYNSTKSASSKKSNKYRDQIGFGYNHSKRVKVKTSPKNLRREKKRRLTKKNITYLKSLGLKVKVN